MSIYISHLRIAETLVITRVSALCKLYFASAFDIIFLHKITKSEGIPVSVSHQDSFFDTFINLTNLAETNITRLFKLISEHINLSRFITNEFRRAFYKHYGRKRKFSLLSFLNALLVKTLFKIPTVKALVDFINASPDCAAFRNLTVAPDETKFSWFMTRFSKHIKALFDNMVQFILPLCQDVNFKRANTLIFDTTGILANVRENSPKFVNAEIKKAKKFQKSNPDFNPYSYFYSHMPKTPAASDCQVSLSYVNGSFAYAHRFGIITNALGIPLDIMPLNNSVSSDNPLSDKDLSDFAALKPAVSTFLNRHPGFVRYSFIGDSAFDNIAYYEFLLGECGFRRAVIPINSRATKFANASHFDSNGIPFCSVCNKPFKFECSTGGKNRAPRFKFLCPLSFRDNKGRRFSACLNPCTDSNCRARYVASASNRRLYPGDVPRGTEHFANIYKQRAAVEQAIYPLKSYSSAFYSSSRNSNTVFSNLVFGAIASLAILILARKLSTKSFKSFNQIRNAV